MNFQATRVAPEKTVLRPVLSPGFLTGFSEKHMSKKSKKKKIQKSAWNAPFTQRLVQPITDIQLWRSCLGVYAAAARLTMPVSNPMERKISIDGAVYGFADIPMNRGMLAIGDFLGDDRTQMPAICNRIMAIGTVLQALRSDIRFSRFFKDDTSDGAYMVSEALTDAFATALFNERTLDINLESVLAIAHRIFDEDPEEN
jgi:hypothetical protein